MQFNMGDTWQRGVNLVSANFGLIAVVAGVFLLIPSLVGYLIIPDMAAMMDPSADPEKLLASMSENAGTLGLYYFLALLFSFTGYCAMVALMGAKGITVGEAIGRGAKSILTLVAVAILFLIVYMFGAFAILLPMGLFGLMGEAVGAIAMGIGILGVLVFVAFLAARLCVTMPVIVLENTLNPVTAMMRSWRLTAPYKWQILGFWVLLFVVYMVLALLIFGLIGLVASLGSGTGSTLILGIVQSIVGALVAMILCGLGVAIFEQLSGDQAGTISETFE